jgi:hypothetical protein
MSAPSEDGQSVDAEPTDIIWMDDRNLLQICEEIEGNLVANDPQLFQCRGAIVWRSPHGVVKADAAFLRVRAMRIATFMKIDRRTQRAELVDPPLKCFTALLRKGEWKFLHLDESAR